MTRLYTFTVEAFYSGNSQEGTVMLTDEEAEQLVRFLQEVEPETWLYTSRLDTVYPALFCKLDEAAMQIIEQMASLLPEDDLFRVYLPDEIIQRAGLNPELD